MQTIPTTQQLNEALGIRQQIDELEGRLASMFNGGSAAPAARAAQNLSPARDFHPVKKQGRPGLTAAGRKRLSAAMKQRWAARRAAVNNA